jgi:hypothetical protein
MAGKNNNSEDMKKSDSEENIERLDDRFIDSAEDEVDIKLTADQEMDDRSIDQLFQDNDKPLDHSIDRLFEEDRKSFKSGLKDEVQKALSQPVMSKASLFRMRTKEPSERSLSEEIAKQKTVEESWEVAKDESSEVFCRKSVIFVCSIIVLIVMVGGWALWQFSNDERGNDNNISALANKSKDQGKRIISQEIMVVSRVIDRYLTAKTLIEKSAYIYQAESFKNVLEIYYESNGGVKPLLDYVIEKVLPINLNGEQVWEVVIKNNHRPTEGSLSYYAREVSDGEYKIDWKADVVFQENDVKKFKEIRSREATNFKFEVNPMYLFSTYNWGFKDSEYQVLRLNIPNSNMVFWGYVKRGSPEQEQLNDSIIDDLKNPIINKMMVHEYILKVRFLADSPNENDEYILIEDLVSRKWINTDE